MGSTASFEEVAHEFAAVLETADKPAIVEAALLRVVRQFVPESRVELLGLGDSVLKPGGVVEVSDESAGRLGRPIHPWAWRKGESVHEVLLRCGCAVHGRLRVRTPANHRSSQSPETLRRLTTLGTMAACAIESLRQHTEWSWEGVARTRVEQSSRTDPADIANPAATDPPGTSLLRDATFLNAVLPFALGQAQRHRESLSLLCVAVDRMAAIRNLLGPEVADRLVREVGQKVATLVRFSDIVARLDDDRIVVVLVRARGANALQVARLICRTVAEASPTDPELPGVTVSVGVSDFPACAQDVLTLFVAADEALAQAQGQGPNTAVMAVGRQDGLPRPCNTDDPR